MDVTLKTKILFFYPLILDIKAMSVTEFIGMNEWLWDNIGEEDIDFEWGHDYILFQSEEDKVKFILRWL